MKSNKEKDVDAPFRDAMRKIMEERRKRVKQRNEAKAERGITERSSEDFDAESPRIKEAYNTAEELRKSKSPSVVPPNVPGKYLNPVNHVITIVRSKKL